MSIRLLEFYKISFLIQVKPQFYLWVCIKAKETNNGSGKRGKVQLASLGHPRLFLNTFSDTYIHTSIMYSRFVCSAYIYKTPPNSEKSSSFVELHLEHLCDRRHIKNAKITEFHIQTKIPLFTAAITEVFGSLPVLNVWVITPEL